MFVADRLRKENIAEYLIYMWQMEDMLRAFHLDIDEVKANYLPHFTDWSEEQRQRASRWYEDLIEMMRSEGVSERGHLQICRNVIINLSDLHHSLLGSQKYPYYLAAYNEALPLIVEFRSRQAAGDDHPELESCFELLYGLTLLRMRQESISDETLEAARKISTLIGMLSDYYHKNLMEPLEL